MGRTISTAAAVLFLAAAMPVHAAGDDSSLTPKLAAICVQGQLNAAGFSVGTVDGDIGPRSMAAAEQYAQANGRTLTALTPDVAEQWCRELAQEDAELQPYLAAALEELAQQNASYGAGGDFRYQIAGNVPESQIDLVKTGLGLAEAYIDTNLGGGIPQEVRQGVTVKIVATGRGNEEYGGGNGTATAFAQAVMRPFFDVANQNWNQNTQGRGWTTRADSMKTVAHEYAHIWHGHLGAISGVRQPLPGWMNEGLAEYIGYRALAESGDIRWSNAMAFMQNGAPQEQMKVPLHQIRIWAGQVAFIAIDWLVDESPNGLMSLRIVAEEIGKGSSAKAAFRAAFGLELDSFYEQFEAWRTKVLENPGRAFAARPKLLLAS